ncbi:MAG: hypothetical protein KF726_22495 [Anaerolineae bacterium]|nr:hypothetical protein [Anaerolineae bacterium]
MSLSLPDPADPTFMCCEMSLAVGEPLYASATRVDVWFALEYARAPGAEALAEADIPQTVKDHLNAALKSIPRSRLQLIRPGKERTKPDPRLHFFVAIGSPETPTLYQFHLDSYDDVLSLDLTRIAAGDPRYEAQRTDQPLYLICINGKRDRACARFGVPVYEAISTHLATLDLQHTVWTTSHLGGHRFAATGVFLPNGICYGRMTPADAARYVDDFRAGRLALEVYRGHCGYDEPVQAAEYFLRYELEMNLLSDLRLLSVEMYDPNSWYVQFEVRGQAQSIGVRVLAEQSTFLTYKNSTDTAGSHVTVYRRLD